MKLPIPVTVITGALGSGKTTAISHLISVKPPHERWSILVNEFGALGIDGALLESASAAGEGGELIAWPMQLLNLMRPHALLVAVSVKELAGGCEFE